MMDIRIHPLDDPARAPRIEELLKNVPTSPGVYLMKDEGAHVIYVGKAKSLRSRVRSYFQRSDELGIKTEHLVSHIYDIEFIIAGTEIEALLLENTLIKKWKPKYNIRLKDDKTYPYIRLDVSHPFPRPYIARKQRKDDGSRYFGPFTDGFALKEVLRMGGRVFQLRDCKDTEFANRSRPCLSYEIGQCTAPCVGKVNEKQYQNQVEDFIGFIEGRGDRLLQEWEKDMLKASENQDYERAAQIRDRIERVRQMVEQEQRMVQTDMVDRDIWTYWPQEDEPVLPLEHDEGEPGDEELEPREPSLFVVVALQFRKGKFVNRLHWSSESEEGLETEDFLGAFLLQHYAKNGLPHEIVIPENSMHLDKFELEEALKSRSPSSDEAFQALHLSHENELYGKLMELADDQAKNIWADKKRRSENSADVLQKVAHFLKLEGPPRVMECVDISNFQGEANVASCVVFVDGKPDKNLYRHYKIMGFEGQNDFKSLQELVSRRYLKNDSPRPDLLVVDGGRAQLSSVMDVLNGAGIKFPVVSLAKARVESDFQSEEVSASEERIFFPGQKLSKKIKDPDVLKLLTQIRDEAHRFAITFHRKQRAKNREGLG